MQNRIDQVRALLREQPDDAFLRFALAQELCNAGELAAGVAAFESLRQQDPTYVGLYYHLGLALLQLDRRDEADAVFADGIDRAMAAGDRHSAETMRNTRYNATLD